MSRGRQPASRSPGSLLRTRGDEPDVGTTWERSAPFSLLRTRGDEPSATSPVPSGRFATSRIRAARRPGDGRGRPGFEATGSRTSRAGSQAAITGAKGSARGFLARASRSSQSVSPLSPHSRRSGQRAAVSVDGLCALLLDRHRGSERHDSSCSSSARRGRHRSPNICTTTTTACGPQ